MSTRKASDDALLAAIVDHVREHGYPPSMRELGAAVGLSSTNSVQRRLLQLREQGRVQYRDGCPRTLTVVVEDQ